MPYYRLPAYLFFCLLPCMGAQAQPPAADSLQAVHRYLSQTGFDARLYNGAEYIRTYSGISGHPFVAADALQTGTIAYDGVLFPAVPLNYDIVRQEVIIRGAQTFLLRLVPEKIDSFTLGNRHFLRAPAGNPAGLPAGFYELLYNGTTQVLAAWKKYSSSAANADERLQFVQAVAYYVVHGKAHRIGSRADLLQAFADRREAVKKHLQTTGLNYRQEPAATIRAAAIFYDQMPR